MARRSLRRSAWPIKNQRRRLLINAVVGLGTGAILAACSSDSADDATDSAPVGATAAANTTPSGQAKPGGILRGSLAKDVATLDPLTASSGETAQLASYTYSRLLKFKSGQGAFADGTLAGDVAESWEQPDDLTLILRLRPGMELDSRPPTNGRTLTTEDVVLSWQKYEEDSAFKGNLSHAANKFAPISSLRAIDDQTIEIKTAAPDAQLLAGLGFKFNLWILPKEAFNGGFDPSNTMRGTGPWLLDQHQSSVSFSFKKNPNYYGGPERPLLDGINLPIIQDTAQLAAQFKAKNIHIGNVPTSDMVSLHKDVSGSRIIVDAPAAGGPTISFGFRENSPFRDKRVRQAVSMLIDRDTFIEVFSDLQSFQGAGVKMRGYWSAPYGAGFGPYWLDPNDSEFGPSAKNFQLNPAEAKKLLEAAGYADGLDTTLTFVAGSAYGRDWGQRAEALMAMLAKGGIRCRANAVDYTSAWIPQWLRVHGNFDGLAMYINSERADPGLWLQEFFLSTGAITQLGDNFPKVDELFASQQRQFDHNRRIEVFHDIQRYFAEEMPTVPQGGATETPSLVWDGVHGPGEYYIWVGNRNVEAAEVYPYYWLDDSLRR